MAVKLSVAVRGAWPVDARTPTPDKLPGVAEYMNVWSLGHGTEPQLVGKVAGIFVDQLSHF
jgi:hypothetical protein